jgi:hypothetical protein
MKVSLVKHAMAYSEHCPPWTRGWQPASAIEQFDVRGLVSSGARPLQFHPKHEAPGDSSTRPSEFLLLILSKVFYGQDFTGWKTQKAFLHPVNPVHPVEGVCPIRSEKINKEQVKKGGRSAE